MQLKFKLTGLIASVLIFSNSFSQVSSVENVQPLLQNSRFVKHFTNAVIGFHQRFPNAENVTWYSLKKNFGATFKMNDVNYRVLLNRKGRLMYKITYGNEKDLPVHIRKMVKGNYVEFLITAASLVEEDKREVWVINLEDESRYVRVSVENNEINETLNMKKKD